MWGEINDPFPSFNGAAVEVWDWIIISLGILLACDYLSMLELKLIYIWKKGRYDLRRCNYWWQKPPFYNFPCSVSDDKTVSTTTFPYQWPSPPSSLLASYLTVATHCHLALYHLDVLKLNSPQHAPDFLLFLVLPVTGERRKGNLKELPVPSGIVTYTRGKGYIWCSISENKRCLSLIMNCYGITLSENILFCSEGLFIRWSLFILKFT